MLLIPIFSGASPSFRGVLQPVKAVQLDVAKPFTVVTLSWLSVVCALSNFELSCLVYILHGLLHGCETL